MYKSKSIIYDKISSSSIQNVLEIKPIQIKSMECIEHIIKFNFKPITHNDSNKYYIQHNIKK